MQCTQCNATNRDDARFCDSCGAGLETTLVRPADDELARIREAFAPKYRVEELLGRGGMALVYRAYDPSLERIVALKVVPRERSDDSAFVDRFRREARLAARLHHPRIISIHEVGTVGEYYYFSMDLIEGANLRAVIQRRGALPAEDALAVVVEICRAVAHAHSKGVIHRDLKPENVMVDKDGDVFVMDFGLARALEEPSMTQTGTVMGSPIYMSPEQIRGETVDTRSDIYAVGLILYYCLTGEDLFAADSVSSVIAKHMSLPVREVVSARIDIPTNIRDPLLAMLEANRETRTREMREVLERLTLRKIVALGLAATEPAYSGSQLVTIPVQTAPGFSRIDVEPEAVGSEIAHRRRARLKALLDEM
jgi:serine/threonine protein kinase